MIVPATKYADVRAGQPARRPVPFYINTRGRREARPRPLREFFEQELREGRLLDTYLRAEKARTEQRLRAAARVNQFRKPNPKSEFQLLASVPARDYFRWKAVDPHFWLDNANLRSLRRDNDALRTCIHV